MQWHSLGEFLSMGGYATYVWGSFGVTAGALLVEAWLLRVRRARALRSASRQQAEDSLS
ncbi:heme exporter protein CcmD [Rhizobacter sp. LjRoot28]|jgi:heme exporter protein D|uniref:heme exporter protein CcmD n=1 Tax=Rhizobacter sp. LjRoot28 TaxID=3342309 RepID=UPI003ECCA6F0